MRKIVIFLPICFLLAWCSLNRESKDNDISLQKIYQQFSNLEKEYPKLPQTTQDNKIVQNKRNSWVVLRINTYIEHINQPQDEDKAFLYTYLNEIFNFENKMYDFIDDPNLYPLQSILPQIASWTTSFEIEMSTPIPTWAIMGCFKSAESPHTYTTILFATEESEKQKIYMLKNDREWHWINKEGFFQYWTTLTGYWMTWQLMLQSYDFDEIAIDNNILITYCNEHIQYRYDNNYQWRQLPFELIKTFSFLTKNNEWKKVWELIIFLNKFSIDPSPFGWRYAKITDYIDIKPMKDWILSLSHIWNADSRPSNSITWLTYMFTKWEKIYLLYLNIDNKNFSWEKITSIQNFQNAYPQDYKRFIDATESLQARKEIVRSHFLKTKSTIDLLFLWNNISTVQQEISSEWITIKNQR